MSGDRECGGLLDDTSGQARHECDDAPHAFLRLSAAFIEQTLAQETIYFLGVELSASSPRRPETDVAPQISERTSCCVAAHTPRI